MSPYPFSFTSTTGIVLPESLTVNGKIRRREEEGCRAPGVESPGPVHARPAKPAEGGLMVRVDVRYIAMLFLPALLAASAARSQPWLGPAAVEVRVEDQKGLPVEGARVQIQYTALNPLDGPAGVLTDSRGHATLGGLAE